jgi:secondary thiamine-phosphate synthase enzyme
MRQAVHILRLTTPGPGLHEITRMVKSWVAAQGIGEGLLTVFCRHTSASLIIQENAARAVRDDLEAFFERLAPEDPARYAHAEEGPDDMPSHIRSALTDVQLSIPVIDSAPALGVWQGVYLFEHRRKPQQREIALHLIGQ